MKARLALAGAALGLVALTGCTNVEQGTVVSKHYDDPDTYFTSVMVGKSVVMVPQHDPAHYRVTLRDCQHQDDGKCAEGDVEVDPLTYDRLSVGDYYDGTEQ